MPEAVFERLSRLIHSECGIKMPPAKMTMLQSRLMRRLRSLDLRSFEEYCDYLLSPEGLADELLPMIDVVTTNKTDFFREPDHFALLAGRVLPELAGEGGPCSGRPVRAWSAGCSTGEEPYTLAMVLNEYMEYAGSPGYSILATDISTSVLERAALGVYELDKAGPVPDEFKRKYLLRNKDRSRQLVRITPELRARVDFRWLNLMSDDYRIDKPLDIIFCRNVLIYFDRPTQEKLLGRLCGSLAPHGYIFVGHSETLTGLGVPLKSVMPTVYKRT